VRLRQGECLGFVFCSYHRGLLYQSFTQVSRGIEDVKYYAA
jgi:hypothetical protein